MKHKMLKLLFLFITCLLVTGCSSLFIESEPVEEDLQPWNKPASWEGNTMGMPI